MFLGANAYVSHFKMANPLLPLPVPMGQKSIT